MPEPTTTVLVVVDTTTTATPTTTEAPATTTTAVPEILSILVTNDDGVGAPGIATVRGLGYRFPTDGL